VQRLTSARDQHESLADAAQQAGAQEKQGQQSDVAQILKAQNDAIKGSGTSEEGSFPELSQPHLVLASPAGIETTTSGSTHIASDQNTAITTAKSLSIASGDSLFASIRQTFRLFVHKAGMKMIAAAGDIDMQALTTNINLLAKLNITHTANRITITAKEEVVINGGGSYAKFNATGIEHGTNGAYVAHAAMHSLPGEKNLPVPPMNLPVVDGFDEQFRLVDEHDSALPNTAYTIRSACGKIWEGVSDADGFTQRVFTEKPTALSLELSQKKAATHDIFFLVNDIKTGNPLVNTKYKIALASGAEFFGTTDAKGHTELVHSNQPEVATIEVPYYGDSASSTNSDCGSDACSC
jgi:type VI secretion system secreted protein VgrG